MKKHLHYTLILSLLAFTAKAQNTEYVLSSFTSPYVELTGATVHGDDSWDDPEITIPLEFPFQMGNVGLESLSQVGLGAEWGSFSFTSFNAVGFFNDLSSSAEATEPGAPATISWVTEGSAGNRMLKIQYKDAAFYEEVWFEESAENRINFQLWFYENGSAIEFRFGSSNIVDAPLVYDGYNGPMLYLATNVQFMVQGQVDQGIYLSGDPANPALMTFDNLFNFEDDIFDGTAMPLNATPANGQVYRLEQLTVSTSNEDQARFTLYPTIAEQEVRLSGELSASQNYRIVNVSGATVQNGVLNNNRVDVSGLAPGVYLMQIDGHMKAQKFVKR